MAFGMAIVGRHGMAQEGHQGMRLLDFPEGWVAVFSGGSAYFQSTLAAGDEIHVDWGDGTSNIYTSSGTRNKNYADNEEYTVTISGTALKVWFNANTTARRPLLKRVLPCDPSKLLRDNNLFEGFYYCTGLTSLPDTLFSDTPELTTVRWCFAYCADLTSLPDTLFSNSPALTDAGWCFRACTGLTSLPDTLFSNSPALTTAAGCFAHCYGLTSLPDTLFSDTPELTSATFCFTSCTGLTSIPSGIFGNAPVLTNVSNCFSWCTEVTGSIPALWTNPNITSFNSCFRDTGHELTEPPNWTHSVSNICDAACADPNWTTGQWTGSNYCNC